MTVNTVITGNLVEDAKLSFSREGKGIANFKVASTRRVKTGDSWADKDTTFLPCVAFDSDSQTFAQNIAETYTKGARVIVMGDLRQEDWTDKEGNKRTSYKLYVEDCGPSLRSVTAKVIRNERGRQTQKQEFEEEPPF